MQRRLWITLLSLATTCGVGACSGSEGADPSSEPPRNVAEDDAAMNEAMRRGSETLPWFIEQWDAAPSREPSIKVGFETRDGGTEFIWFVPMAYADGTFQAQCANDPMYVDGLKLGDMRQVTTTDIVDWMIRDGSTWYGAYTVRVFEDLNDGTITFRDPD